MITVNTQGKSAFKISNGATVKINDVNLIRKQKAVLGLESLILVNGATLEAKNITITEDCTQGVFEVSGNGELTIGGSTNVTSGENSTQPIFNNIYGTVIVNDGTYIREGDLGQVVGSWTDNPESELGKWTDNGNSTFIMYGGTITNVRGTSDTIANGNIFIYGGTITSGNSAAVRTGKERDQIFIDGVSDENTTPPAISLAGNPYALQVGKKSIGGKVTIGGSVKFNGKMADIYLYKKTAVITIEDDFTDSITVKSSVALEPNEKRPITTTGTAITMSAQVTPAGNGQAISYSGEKGGYLYLWNHGHTSGEVATCIDPQVCSDKDCNTIIVKALGHDHSVIKYNDTQHWHKCSRCDSTTEKVSHDHNAIVTAPTCTEGGYTTYTCACGDTYTGDVVDALDHNMVVDAAVPATCTTPGLTEGSHCTRCDHKVAQKVVDALQHAWATAWSSDATVEPLDDKQIELLLSDEHASGDVVIDLTGLDRNIDTASIPKESLEAIVEAAEKAGNDTEHLVIKLSTAELKLDDAALRAIVDQADGNIILAPAGHATRAQVATMLMTFCQMNDK